MTKPMTSRTPGLPRSVVGRHTDEPHFIRAGDGLPLTLIRVRGERPPVKGPVLLVHGAGVRGEIFRPPVPVTFVDALVADGWDVWMLNWRASIDLDPVPWTLDDAAAYDHPAAVRYVLAQTGADSLKAVVHCQGSTSFVMAAVAGLLPGVSLIVSNAVSLHPVLPPLSRLKIGPLRSAIQAVTPGLNPAWGDSPDSAFARLVRALVELTHHECDNRVCHMVSFTYGSGHPALWSHANLDDATHDWLRYEFGKVPMSFFAQMHASERAGQLVSVTKRPGLQERYADSAPKTDARFVLVAGAQNRCFLPASQVRTHEFLQLHRPGKDSLYVLPGYGHLDVFLGKDAHADVFPMLLGELNAG
jgi:alpha/beta hydrolase fold